MEIPKYLKTLYKHWEKHTTKPVSNLDIELNEEVLNQIFPVIMERMLIWEKRQTNCIPPYTQNNILANYRFCNIYRELDRQTIEIHKMLKPIENNFDTWLLNLIFLRMVCNPETIKKVGFLDSQKSSNKDVYERLIKLQRPIYGNAYIFPISIIQKAGYKTREEFFCFYLPMVIKKCTNVIKNLKYSSVSDALSLVLPVFGINFKFHWTEVFIDIAYQFPEYIDLYKTFPVGPGALPTIKKLNPSENPEKVCSTLTRIEVPDFPYLTFNGRNIWLSAENWEGIGCEFRKYTNLKNGVGRKRKYHPSNS